MQHTESSEGGLHCWLYVSRCLLAPAWASAAIDAIVAVSRPRNATLEVTGSLIFSGRHFAQFIEGPGDAIETLRTAIFQDARHTDIETVMAQPRTARTFTGWALAYAGPSLFVERNLNAALDASPHSVERLVGLLQEFAAR